MIDREPGRYGSGRIPPVASILALLRPTHVVVLLIGVFLVAAPDIARTVSASQASELEFRIRAEEGLEGIARSIVTDAGATSEFPGIGSPELWIRDTVDLILLRDLSTLQEAGFGPPERWVAGLADPEGLRIALRAGTELETMATLRTVFRHELAHLLVHAASGGRAPRWLHEGYAQFASGAWGWDDAWRIQFALFRSGSGSLRDVDLRFRSNPEEIRLAYLLSYTVVQELHSLGGDAGISALFGSLRNGDSLDVGLRGVYGLTQEQFERRWRATVMDRYGWLYLLSRAALFWLLITVVVLTVGLRRMRSDRQRLEEMRERERETESEEDLYVDYGQFEG
jgi:hypothetical protein